MSGDDQSGGPGRSWLGTGTCLWSLPATRTPVGKELGLLVGLGLVGCQGLEP